ncbi:MAG: ATP-binding protein [Candidatus Firestonebacteria bacterium]
MITRYIQEDILKDIKSKMIFVGGPRQVGKTTLAKMTAKEHFTNKSDYLNWDSSADRKLIITETFKAGIEIIIFDELHKFKNWKNYIKGIYDKNAPRLKIIVTGSARLDIFRKGGDSLLGRYRYYRLHPLSVAEVSRKKNRIEPFKEFDFSNNESKEVFDRLLKFGGFPEIYFSKDESDLRRWHNERAERIVKEDIRDIERVSDLSALLVLVELLKTKVSSHLSINSLTEDLKVSFKTVSSWIDILERFYYHFRVYPYQSKKIQALKKEAKLYLWDWSDVEDEPARLENIVASHLLKLTHYLYDSKGYKTELFYIRDKEQRETDFLVTVNNNPWFSVEVKTKYKNISTPHKYFKEKLNIPFNYIVTTEKGIDHEKDGFRIISIEKFLSGMM